MPVGQQRSVVPDKTWTTPMCLAIRPLRRSHTGRTGLAFLRREGVVAGGRCTHPTLLSWLGQLRPRQVNHEPVITMDWTATLLELGGAAPHPSYRLDRSCWPRPPPAGQPQVLGSAPEESMTNRADLDTVSTQAL
jgi:arylsulfatase A-like enzyme